MNRRLRRDIVNRQILFILVSDLRRDFLGDHFREDGFLHDGILDLRLAICNLNSRQC